MGEKSFDASKYLTKVNGKDYLEVKWRLLWLRTEYPEAILETELVRHEGGLALFKAKVSLPNGAQATGWGSETASDFEDYIEKAETKAIGRACAALGFGTQFCEDFVFHGETGHFVDAPVERPRGESKAKAEKVATNSLATVAQLKAIYVIAHREHSLGEEQVNERCREIYRRPPAELTKKEASAFIDRLKGTVGRPKADRRQV